MRPVVYIALLLLPVLSQAQVEGLLHKRFGLRVGANTSTFNVIPLGYYYSYKAGFYIGGYYQFRLKHNIGLATEIGYSRLGSNNSDESQVQVLLRLNYITVPVSLKYYFNERLNLQLGVYGSTLLNATGRETLAYVDGVYHPILDKYFSAFDGGIHAGIGFETKMGLNVSVRYFNSLGNIYSKYWHQYSGLQLRNEFVQLSIGYSFKNKHSNK